MFDTIDSTSSSRYLEDVEDGKVHKLILKILQPKSATLDSVSNLFGGDEDNKFYLKQFIQSCCARIARSANCAVLLCKHDNAEKVTEYDDKIWHLIKSETTTEESMFYG
ncbi:MAG: hypothetical protein PG981_001405 [Wolbachia endosymbiont of Ctenocephalides orientis wCori]|nr:MAG: hypothetical protein PG981_001405 [Wolbachia endosymbiont of Ctenocephalides orientis wCori]